MHVGTTKKIVKKNSESVHIKILKIQTSKNVFNCLTLFTIFTARIEGKDICAL